ncbi:MAG: glycogen-binding domain-containing protein [Victivallales bacterium]|nr:glycogen-binding domain-containing protein [Victivallales bacterium]
MTKKSSNIDLERLSDAVRSQLDTTPKPRGRKPGSKNRPKGQRYHGFKLGQPRGHRVVFTYCGAPGQDVYVAGDFNNWDPLSKQLIDKQGNGTYSIRCLVLPGRHEYKFVVNGEWILDPANQEHACNERGDWNNVLIVE